MPFTQGSNTWFASLLGNNWKRYIYPCAIICPHLDYEDNWCIFASNTQNSIIQIVKYTAYPLKFIIFGNVNENIRNGYNSAFKFLKIIFKKV